MSEARKAEMQAEFEAKVQQLQQFTQEKFGPEGELMRKNIELIRANLQKDQRCHSGHGRGKGL